MTLGRQLSFYLCRSEIYAAFYGVLKFMTKVFTHTNIFFYILSLKVTFTNNTFMDDTIMANTYLDDFLIYSLISHFAQKNLNACEKMRFR